MQKKKRVWDAFARRVWDANLTFCIETKAFVQNIVARFHKSRNRATWRFPNRPRRTKRWLSLLKRTHFEWSIFNKYPRGIEIRWKIQFGDERHDQIAVIIVKWDIFGERQWKKNANSTKKRDFDKKNAISTTKKRDFQSVSTDRSFLMLMLNQNVRKSIQRLERVNSLERH